MWWLAVVGCPTPTPSDVPVEPLSPVCPLADTLGSCGSPQARASLFPGPLDLGHDPSLELRAVLAERATALTRVATGASCEVVVNDVDAATQWVASPDGTPAEDQVSWWLKSAGAYAGVAIAADAYRYGALRDEGAPCDQVEAAREVLLSSLEVLHLAQEVTGSPGVIARGFARKGWEGAGVVHTTPLFDPQGRPLPAQKTNGTWREDVSGAHPDIVWEDSVSRDQYIGWVAGIAAAWEVVQADPDIPEGSKQQLRADALLLLQALQKVQESGFDLELQDADGRPTFHATLHHTAAGRAYVPAFRNALYAIMSLGIVSALVSVTDDADARVWLEGDLIGARDLPEAALSLKDQLPLGTRTNFSNLNMAYLGGWLALRHICHKGARSTIHEALRGLHEEGSGGLTAPITQQQGLFDLVVAVGERNTSNGGGAVDEAARDRALASLAAFRPFPNFDDPLQNCDPAEIDAGVCELSDGSVVDLLGTVGRNDALISSTPVPMAARVSSNYHWRSHPFEVNGGGGGTVLYPSSDWRFVYWAGRYTR